MTFEKMCIRDRNAKIVGQSAHTIAALAGVDVPEETKILIGEVESVELSEEFAHEKLSPVLAMYHAKDFDEALDKAEKLVCDGGHGHTASLYIHPAQKEKIMEHAERMEACRIVINTPSSFGGIGDLYNFKMAPSLTLGCGKMCIRDRHQPKRHLRQLVEGGHKLGQHRQIRVLPARLCGVLLLEPLFSGGKIMFHAHGGTLPSASMNVRISFHDYSIACARAQPSLDEWGRLCYNFREERRAP